MRAGKIIMIGALCAVAQLSLNATSYCDQKFRFVGVTTDYTREGKTFWIIEDMGGECGNSTLWQITDADGEIIVLSSELKYEKYGGFLLGFNDFKKYDVFELKNDGDKWKYGSMAWSLRIKKLPISSSEIKKFYIPGSRYVQEMKGLNYRSFDLPQIEGLDMEPIYCGIHGLYRNFTISRIYYIRPMFDLGYLLIFTRFKSRISSMDTAHGFILFRIKNPPKLERN